MTDGRTRARRRAEEETSPSLAAVAGRWLRRAMEVLWLLAVGFVPVLFAPPELMAFIDLPKVALLRTLTGLMALVWVAEWALRPPGNRASGAPRSAWTRFRHWTREDPSRWIVVGGTLFFAGNVISALLSPAVSVSLWGSNPGRDGYGLYNTASYYLLFVVIATRLKSRAQLWRLLIVIAAASTVASLYGVLQHYGADPFNQGHSQRVQSSFGNPLFAGSFLVMAVPVSLGLALARRRSRFHWVEAGWVVVVAIHFMAVMFTLSRGPWIALAVGILAWMGMVGAIAGKRIFVRALVTISLAIGLAIGVVMAPALQSGSEERAKDDLLDRAASISSEATTGGLHGRLSIWKRSVSLIVERPWIDAAGRGSLPLRHLFGYGPEMFLYTLPLRWAPDALEPVNASAHNYFIHLAVELGLMGVLAYGAAVASILIGGGVTLLRRRHRLTVEIRLIYAALLTSVVVRVVEQMAGVARVSDLTLFWAIAGAAAGLMWVTRSDDARALAPARDPDTTPTRASRRSTIGANAAWRWGIALVVVTVGSLFIWQKNISYIRAAALSSASVSAFQQGDLLSSLELMDRAIDAAPEVELYYASRAKLMDAYTAEDASDEIQIATVQYDLNAAALRANPLSHTARLAAANSALKLARLGQQEKGAEAIQLYRELAQLLPGYQQVHTDLASVHLVLGQPSEALAALDGYLHSNGGNRGPSAEAQYVRGLAYGQLGRTEEALRALEMHIQVSPTGGNTAHAHQVLAELYHDLGQQEKRDEHAARYEALRPN